MFGTGLASPHLRPAREQIGARAASSLPGEYLTETARSGESARDYG